jgi:hypothetical protein
MSGRLPIGTQIEDLGRHPLPEGQTFIKASTIKASMKIVALIGNL